MFRVPPLEDSPVFPEVGFYRQEDETLEYGNNEPLLRQVATATGGRFRPEQNQLFDAGGRSISTTMQLRPAFTRPGSAADLAELVLRKPKDLAESLDLRPRVAEG